MGKLDDLIIQLRRLGYRTQTLGKEIVVEFAPGSRVRGSQEQIEKILPKLNKKRRDVGLISTWALREHPDYVPPAERADKKRSSEKEEREAVNLYLIQHPANSPVAQPTYAELLARLRRLETQRDTQANCKVSLRDRTGKAKKKKKRKRKAKQQISTVPGGLPGLGKRR